jgi:hypothetical protein
VRDVVKIMSNKQFISILFVFCTSLLIGLFISILSSQAQQGISQPSDIIVFHKPLLPNKRNRLVNLIQSFGGRVKYRYQIIDAIAVRGLPDRFLQSLSRDPDIVGFEADGEVQAHLIESIPIIGADQAVQNGETGDGIKVCVLDTGIDNNHPAFGDRIILQNDFVNGDDFAQDDNDHGSHVAGIIGSEDGSYTGVAPNVKFLIGKVLNQHGSGSLTDVIAGMDWCVANKAQVINMSLGGGLVTGNCDTDAAAMAANNAVEAGVVVVTSSGNDGATNAMAVPACASDTIAVGATYDYSGTLLFCCRTFFGFCARICSESFTVDEVTFFSNGGTGLDVVAPGSIITSVDAGSSGFKDLSGTSMSAPHVSGLVALLLGEDPTLLPKDIREIIRATAKDIPPQGADNAAGYGRVDAIAALEATVPIGCTDNIQCDDGNTCNGSETCQDGSCIAGTAISCDDGIACTVDSCDPASGCVNNDDNCNIAACGDRVCGGITAGEDCTNCQADCGSGFFRMCCGNGACEFFEFLSCPVDCS